MKVIQTVG
jgi:hypothetical protein